jgi:hypothetical protein
MQADKSGMKKLTGKCMCGAVAFEFIADKMKITACHCGQCRAWSGHYWASINAPFDTLRIRTGEESLGWFRSSGYARRGYCTACGSALFWHGDKLDDYKHRIAIGAGSLDAPTGAAMAEHIFVVDKGDYYDIADGLPQLETH